MKTQKLVVNVLRLLDKGWMLNQSFVAIGTEDERSILTAKHSKSSAHLVFDFNNDGENVMASITGNLEVISKVTALLDAADTGYLLTYSPN